MFAFVADPGATTVARSTSVFPVPALSTALMRVELTAIATLLIESGAFNVEQFQEACAKEAELLDKDYEKKFPGFRTSAEGIVIYDKNLAADTTRHWKP